MIALVFFPRLRGLVNRLTFEERGQKRKTMTKTLQITVVTRCFVIFMLCDTQVSLVDFELQAIDIKICGGGEVPIFHKTKPVC